MLVAASRHATIDIRDLGREEPVDVEQVVEAVQANVKGKDGDREGEVILLEDVENVMLPATGVVASRESKPFEHWLPCVLKWYSKTFNHDLCRPP